MNTRSMIYKITDPLDNGVYMSNRDKSSVFFSANKYSTSYSRNTDGTLKLVTSTTAVPKRLNMTGGCPVLIGAYLTSEDYFDNAEAAEEVVYEGYQDIRLIYSAEELSDGKIFNSFKVPHLTVTNGIVRKYLVCNENGAALDLDDHYTPGSYVMWYYDNKVNKWYGTSSVLPVADRTTKVPAGWGYWIWAASTVATVVPTNEIVEITKQWRPSIYNTKWNLVGTSPVVFNKFLISLKDVLERYGAQDVWMFDNKWYGVQQISTLRVVNDVSVDRLYKFVNTKVVDRYDLITDETYAVSGIGPFVLDWDKNITNATVKDYKVINSDTPVKLSSTLTVPANEVTRYLYDTADGDAPKLIEKYTYTKYYKIQRYIKSTDTVYTESYGGKYVNIGNSTFVSILDVDSYFIDEVTGSNTSYKVGQVDELLYYVDNNGKKTGYILDEERPTGFYHIYVESTVHENTDGDGDKIVTKDCNGMWVKAPSTTKWFTPKYGTEIDEYPEKYFPVEQLSYNVPQLLAGRWYLLGNPDVDTLDVESIVGVGNIEKIFWFQPDSGSWVGYTSTGTLYTNGIAKKVPSSYGYWVRVINTVAAQTVEVSGFAKPYIYRDGWNLVAYNKEVLQVDTFKALAEELKAKTIWSYDASNDNWKGIKSSDSIVYTYNGINAETEVLTTGDGIWVKGVADRRYVSITAPATPSTATLEETTPEETTPEETTPEETTPEETTITVVDNAADVPDEDDPLKTYKWPAMQADTWYMLGNPSTSYIYVKELEDILGTEILALHYYEQFNYGAWVTLGKDLKAIPANSGFWIKVKSNTAEVVRDLSAGYTGTRKEVVTGWNLICENYVPDTTIGTLIIRYGGPSIVKQIWVFDGSTGQWYDDPATIVNPNNVALGVWIQNSKNITPYSSSIAAPAIFR